MRSRRVKLETLFPFYYLFESLLLLRLLLLILETTDLLPLVSILYYFSLSR